MKPPAREVARPSAPGRSAAPSTATEAGRRRCATAATPASRWRASKRRRVARQRRRELERHGSVGPVRGLTGKPESWNTPSMWWFSDRTVAVNALMPSAEAACARWASSTVAIPWSCQASATAKATSARFGVSRKYVACATTVLSTRSAIRASPSSGAAALRPARVEVTHPH